MESILTPEQQRVIDRKAIEDFAMPALLLMENAGRSCADTIRLLLAERHISEKPSVLILCGSGNNGGDGFCIARHLNEYAHVRIAWLGEKEKMSPETITNFICAERLGIPMAHISTELDVKTLSTDAHCIIDAIIGVGGDENLRGIITFLLDKVSGIWDSFGQLPELKTDSLRIAIDMPSGLNGLTGKAHSSAFRADYTITMIAPKIGMLINEGMEVSGNVHSVSIGEPASLKNSFDDYLYHDKGDIRRFIPHRLKKTSKFDYGRVIIIGGSASMPGAACLSAHAALCAGAGLVEIYTPSVHPLLPPEIMPHILQSTKEGTIHPDELSALHHAIEKADAVIIGPGLGKNEDTIAMIRSLIFGMNKKTPLILDADGLSALQKEDILRPHIILTPHLGEFARLIRKERESIDTDALDEVKKQAQEMNCTIVLKHTPVIITDGKKTVFNMHGNAGMATAGSGDVLAGIIGTLAAQKIMPLYAASLGAYIHSLAGDYAANNSSQETMRASDIISSLFNVFAV